MPITIRSTTPLTDKAAGAVRGQAAFVFGRFGPRIRSVTIRLGDRADTRADAEHACSIAVQLTGARHPIVVTDADTNAAVAMARALARAARTVARSLRQRQGAIPPA